MSTYRKWWLFGGAVLAVVFLAPYGVEWAVDRAGRVEVADRGLSADWESVDWFWTDSVALEGVQLSRGPVERASVDRLSVDVGVFASIVGTPAIDGVQMQGVEVIVDVSEVEGRSGDDAEGGGGVEDVSGGFELSDLGRVAVERFHVDMLRGGTPVGRIDGDLRLEAALGGEREASGSGTFAVGRADAAAVRWQYDGQLSPALERATGEVSFAEADAEPTRDDTTVDVDVGPARVGLAGVAFTLDRQNPTGSRIHVEKPFARVAEGEQKAGLAVTAPRLDLRFDTGTPLHVRADGMSVAVAPRLLVERLAGGGESRGAGSGGGASGGTASTALPALGRLRERFVSAVDLTFRETEFALHVHDDDTGWQTVRPAENIGIRKRGRHLEAAGKFAGGWAAGSAAWDPGLLLPRFASLRVEGVDLEKVPIVRQGRSLPNRGVRGKIGGHLDVDGSFLRTGQLGGMRERMTGLVDVRLRDGWVYAGGLADEPVHGKDLAVELSVDWQPQLQRVRLRDSSVEYGPLGAQIEGRVEDWPLEPFVAFETRFDEFDCHRAIRSIPATLLGPYREIVLDGKATPTFAFQVPVADPGDVSIDVDGFPGECNVTALKAREEGYPKVRFVETVDRMDDEPAPALEEEGDDGLMGMFEEDEPSEPALTATRSETRFYAAPPEPADPIDPPRELTPVPKDWREDEPDDVFWLKKPFVMQVTEGVSKDAKVEVGPGLDSYVPLEAMPTYVAGAAYLSEEINFYDDGGWNFHLIQKALQLNFEGGRFVYGGSTVTQQLVKNLFLSRNKTLARKIQEALIAWRIQGVVSKDRVLELYLNCIEFGDDLYGIGPAAQFYFKKHASELTILEAVFLAVIKPAPWFGPKFVERGHTPEKGWWYDRIEQIIERLVQKGFITEEQAEEARPYVLRWDDAGKVVRPSAE